MNNDESSENITEHFTDNLIENSPDDLIENLPDDLIENLPDDLTENLTDSLTIKNKKNKKYTLKIFGKEFNYLTLIPFMYFIIYTIYIILLSIPDRFKIMSIISYLLYMSFLSYYIHCWIYGNCYGLSIFMLILVCLVTIFVFSIPKYKHY